MTAIEASTVGVKTMADGTLRITLDIEPRFAKDAFGLFGAPGTPCALAALRTGDNSSPVAEKPKGGPLARLAGQWCNDVQFQNWIAIEYHNFLGDVGPDDFATRAEFARHCILVMCVVDSRAELDHSQLARDKFERYIRQKYMARGGSYPA
jgi:hypothetical protein